MKVIKIDIEKIQKHAKREKWTQNAIARESGLNVATVNKAVRGITEPSATTLKRICDVIELPIQDAFIEKAAA